MTENELTPEIKSRLLSYFPAGTQLLEAQTYRSNYMPYPARIVLQTPSGDVQRCVIKLNRPEPAKREVRALEILSRLGLPVPTPLSEPILLSSEDRALFLASELSGRALPWCGINSLAEANLTCRLVLEGVTRLHQVTKSVQEMDTASIFPRHTLNGEHAAIVAEAGDWMRVERFRYAVEIVGGALEAIITPLVFSNGDYNPLNFLYDGSELCGFVDFEGACFENPHIGFAKFLIWSYDDFGWGTGEKIGLVERYLYSRNVSRHEFAPILTLRCLRHLIQDVSPEADESETGRSHLMRLIEEGVRTIEAKK